MRQEGQHHFLTINIDFKGYKKILRTPLLYLENHNFTFVNTQNEIS